MTSEVAVIVGIPIFTAAIGAAAKANNLQKALASYIAVGKYCNGCHTAHREQMPDKSYKIKP